VLAAAAAAASHAETNRLPNHPMHIPPQSPKWLPNWRRRVLALTALLLVANCANGDFGEVRPMLVRDDIHDWVGHNAIVGRTISPSSFELTDDERQLRDLAYPLIEPPYDRQQWYSVLGEYGVISSERGGIFDRSAYANRLSKADYRSPSARYSKITEDIRNDVTRMPQFFETAARVLDVDQKRRKSLAYISDLSPKQREHALRRVRENASLVSLVSAKMEQRVKGYRYALERLVVVTPSPQAIEVERSLNQMQAQIVRYRTHTAPTWAREQSLAAVQ